MGIPEVLMMKAIVTVTLKPSILDPQGEAVAHALNHMGVKGVKSVRIGKHIELEIEGGEEMMILVPLVLVHPLHFHGPR